MHSPARDSTRNRIRRPPAVRKHRKPREFFPICSQSPTRSLAFIVCIARSFLKLFVAHRDIEPRSISTILFRDWTSNDESATVPLGRTKMRKNAKRKRASRDPDKKRVLITLLREQKSQCPPERRKRKRGSSAIRDRGSAICITRGPPGAAFSPGLIWTTDIRRIPNPCSL